MPMISIGRDDVLRLREFCRLNNTTFYLAKDHGAYVGASTSAAHQCLWFFAGCDPDRDPDWYDTTVKQFGDDDFGEVLPLDWLHKVAFDPTITRMNIIFTQDRITADFMRR